jgi:hypothetical protein
LVVRGLNSNPIVVATNIDEITYEMSKTHQANWGDGNIHQHELWKDENVMYNGYAIFGMIDKATGHGTGIAVKMGGVEGGHAHMLFQWRYNFEPIACVEYWDDTQRAAGAKRYYYAVTGGREELVEIGKQLVDGGVASLTPTGVRKAEKARESEPFAVRTKGRELMIRAPRSQIRSAKLFGATGTCLRHVQGGEREEMAVALPDVATGVCVLQVETKARLLSKIVRIMR